MVVREAPEGREPAVNSAWCKLTRFQVDSTVADDGFVEGKPGFGAVPGDELVYRVPVSSLGFSSRAGY
jgi:hypothetical protein